MMLPLARIGRFRSSGSRGVAGTAKANTDPAPDRQSTRGRLRQRHNTINKAHVCEVILGDFFQKGWDGSWIQGFDVM